MRFTIHLESIKTAGGAVTRFPPFSFYAASMRIDRIVPGGEIK